MLFDWYTSVGRQKLLQCLLSIHQTLSTSEPYYILNNLYITDYCVWVQHSRYTVLFFHFFVLWMIFCSSQQLEKLAEALDKVIVTKSEVGWELDELELAAKLVAQTL